MGQDALLCYGHCDLDCLHGWRALWSDAYIKKQIGSILSIFVFTAQDTGIMAATLAWPIYARLMDSFVTVHLLVLFWCQCATAWHTQVAFHPKHPLFFTDVVYSSLKALFIEVGTFIRSRCQTRSVLGWAILSHAPQHLQCDAAASARATTGTVAISIGRLGITRRSGQQEKGSSQHGA